MSLSDPNLYILGCALLSVSAIHHSRVGIAGGGSVLLSVVGLVASVGGLIASVYGIKVAGAWPLLASFLGGPFLYSLTPSHVRTMWTPMILMGFPLVGAVLLFIGMS